MRRPNDPRIRRAATALAALGLVLGLAAPAAWADDDPKPLDVPFFRQKDEGCVQAQMRMVLGYFDATKSFTQAELDRRTGRNEGQWTWLSQVLPVLVAEGLDAYFFSSLDYFKLHPSTLEHLYDAETAAVLDRVTNWDSVLGSLEFLKTSGRFQHKKLTGADLQKAFEAGQLVIAIIDSNVIKGREDMAYLGHAVTITFYGVEQVVYHDSAHGPSQKVTRERFEKAWNARGTDNDTIIVRGLRKEKRGEPRKKAD